MRLITPQRLTAFGAQYPEAANRLQAWGRVAAAATWASLADVRKDFPSADGVVVRSRRVVTVFNIGGGKYRLITAIHYNTRLVYVMRFLTHAQYDKDQWKEQL